MAFHQFYIDRIIKGCQVRKLSLLLQQIIVFLESLIIRVRRIRTRFKGSSLKRDKVTFTPGNVINLFIVFELDTWSEDLRTDFTLMLIQINILIQDVVLGLILNFFHFQILIGVKMLLFLR